MIDFETDRETIWLVTAFKALKSWGIRRTFVMPIEEFACKNYTAPARPAKHVCN